MKLYEKPKKPLLFFLLGAGIVLVVYFLILRRLLAPGLVFPLELGVIGLLLIFAVITSLLIVVNGLILLFSKKSPERGKKLWRKMILLVSVLLIVVVFVGASQLLAHTPPILGEDGKPLPGSIASLEKVRLGGVDQWLIIRGQDVNKPVLLFLSGGPGASEAARVLRFNQDLEKDFVVVIWEQRGCGKSYPSINPKSALSIDQYTADIIELSEMLRERFDEEKIYLVGHSWGTIIGVHAVQARPDLFHAYVSTSQMVDVEETDQLIYKAVMEHSFLNGDMDFVGTLIKQGQPPYFGKNPIQPYSTLFGREYAVYEFPNIKNEEFRKDGDILLLMLKQPEYGWLDRVYYLLGLMNTFNATYPQLQTMDFRQSALEFDLPVYFILGRHDMNNPSQIPEEYFNLLNAPKKQLIYFEESGHGMLWEEADLFYKIMLELVLTETYP